MSDPFQASLRIAGAGLQAQALRMQIVSENIANSHTTGGAPGDDPYRRKTVTFGEEMSRADGVRYVRVRSVGQDASSFHVVHDPGNPAANAKGEVKMPNVDPILELADLREANHDYQAGLQVLRQVRDLFSMTIDLLRS
ncbi:MAG TPA: flagellar basal body rod protein FlgC [Rhodoblastus sp.]|nr:flagellar basal body rod protein FlgC [Rhodoblastus sp.]